MSWFSASDVRFGRLRSHHAPCIENWHTKWLLVRCRLKVHRFKCKRPFFLSLPLPLLAFRRYSRADGCGIVAVLISFPVPSVHGAGHGLLKGDNATHVEVAKA